jgi:phosphoserine aminotransferase
MQIRPFNFAPGPATLPIEVLEQAASEMLDWQGSGMSVMEMSHRGRDFLSIHQQAQEDLRAILALPSEFEILFMQGGALTQNALVPLNLSRGQVADFVVTGAWSDKSYQEAARYCTTNLVASNFDSNHTTLPSAATWQLSSTARYVHLCTNETIHGVEFPQLPDLQTLGSDACLVIDCSSNIASRTVDWSRVGLAYAGAQKNIGPAGLTVVMVRKDLLGPTLQHCPSAMNYQTVAQHNSMLNTPPTYAIYMAGLVFAWIRRQTQGDLQGLAAIEARNVEKSSQLYDYIDTSGFYSNKVDRACRSRMNVPFFLCQDALNDAFVEKAQAQGLLQLRGHKTLGGMRASLYNAMPLLGVQALIAYMKEFAARHG